MIGAVLGPVLGGLKRLVYGFVMLGILIFLVAKYTDIGMSAQQALHEYGDNATALVTGLLSEVIQLLKAMWETLTRELQR